MALPILCRLADLPIFVLPGKGPAMSGCGQVVGDAGDAGGALGSPTQHLAATFLFQLIF